MTGVQTCALPILMPARVAATDPYKAIGEYVGSGPYIFKKDEYKAGVQSIYLKNTKYVPRSEPPSGLAGGKKSTLIAAGRHATPASCGFQG